MRLVPKPTRYFVISIITLILLFLNVYAVKALIIFGSPVLFLLALLAEITFIGVFIYSLVRALSKPESIVKSLALSIWGGLATNDYIKKLRKSKSPLLIWFKRRVSRNSQYGLALTLTLLLAAFFLVNFLSLLFNVSSKASVTHVDTRVLNLIPSIRTSAQTTFFRFVTTFANVESTILLIVAIVFLLWRKRQRPLIGIVLLAAASEESITYIVKSLVHRMRPDKMLSLIRADGFSFPSGHVVRATVLFGLLTYLIYKTFPATWIRLTAIGWYILTVFLVSVSRIYLGVHYPTDVWGSVLLGSFMLTLVIGSLEIGSRYELFSSKKMDLSNKTMLSVPVFLLAFALIASPSLVHIQPVTATRTYITLLAIDKSTIRKLPLYSETLTGSHMEPINFIYVGSRNQIVSAFLSHGWHKADPSTLSNTLKALAVGFQGRQYVNAPVTPSYLNFRPENLAFEQSTKSNSLRQRHHTRLWLTDYVLPSGNPIWVATASFDEGVEFAGPAKLPTHHIDPNVDDERLYIAKSLGLPIKFVSVVPPQLGKNASGDNFFTDGKAELVYLK